MIKINLLPENVRRKENAIKIPLMPAIFVVVSIILSLHVVFGLVGFYKKMQFVHLDRTWRKMRPQFEEVSGLKNKLTEKRDNVRVMEYVLKREVYWTDFLNKINLAVPKGLWFNHLTLSPQGLVIEGSVFSFSTDEVSLINKFSKELKKDDFFKQNFNNFSLDSVQRRTIKQYEVLDFLLTAEVKKEQFEVEYGVER